MFRSKVMMIVVLALILALPVGLAAGQGDGGVFCGDLSEADCAILVDAQAAMAGIESAAFAMDAEMAFAGMAFEPGMDSMRMGFNGEGVFWMDTAAMQALEAEAQAAFPNDPAGVLTGFLGAIAADATFTLSLPEMDGQRMAFDVILVDGVMYMDFGAMMGEDAAGTMTWMGLDLSGMYETMFSESGGGEMFGGLGELMESLGGLVDGSELFTGLEGSEMVEDFMTIERLADQDIMGQGTAVFQTTLDYGALFSDAGFLETMQAGMMLGLQAQAQEMSAEEVQATLQATASMMQNMNITIEEWIGLDDAYMHRMAFNMAMTMDMSEMAAIAGEDDLPGGGTLDMNIRFTLDLSDFNAPVEITAPEDAPVINPMMMMDAPA